MISLDEALGLIEFFRQIKRVARNLIRLQGISIEKANKLSYNSLYRVEAYASVTDLQKPEKTILNVLGNKTPFRKMLDIGVGAGRTTKYFSKITRDYIGIDYSENMIKVCREKFKGCSKVSFAVADARNLSIYEDNCFDFILDSACIDSVRHQDRVRILHEIWRVARNGAYFCFSTSNLDAMLQFCRIERSLNPKVFAGRLVKLLLVRLLNPGMWRYVRGNKSDLEHTLFITGADDWGLKTYCITPEAQIKQLKDVGFGNIRIFNLQGKETTHITNTTDVALFFLCNAEKID